MYNLDPNDVTNHLKPANEFEYFYFLLYSSNPIRQNVKIYIDGNDKLSVMRHDRFLRMIEETVGFQITAAVKDSLNTYGTFWILDRESNSIHKVSAQAGEDPRNVRDMMNVGHQANTPEAIRKLTSDTINPGEVYANAQLELPFFDQPEPEDTSRTKRRGISLLLPRKRD